MKDEEFKDFDKKPKISNTIIGQHPFDSDDYWSEEARAYTFD